MIPTATLQKLTESEKRAAVVLVVLGAGLSAEVMRNLPDDLVERLTYAISTMEAVPPELRQEITEDIIQEIEARRQFNVGGVEFARKVLSQALGRERAEELLSRITHRDADRPFDFLADIEPVHVARVVQEEHSQTIALILAHLPPMVAARIFSALPEERRTEVINRIGMMDRISPDVVRTVEAGVKQKLSSILPKDQQGEQHMGGVDYLVQLFNHVDRTTEKTIMSELTTINPELADQVQSQMFVFEDLIMLDKRSLELVMREVDKKDLLLALRGAPENVREVLLQSISKRAARMIQEDLAVMGPVRLTAVEEAQKNIVKIVRRLEQEEQIVISRGGSDDMLI